MPESGAAPQQQGLDYASIAPFIGEIPGRFRDGSNRFLHSDYLNLPYAHVSFVYRRILEGPFP